MFKKIVSLLCILFSFQHILAVECVITSNSQECCGQMIFEPSTLAEIQQIILDANTQNKKVRATAGTHGSVDAICTSTQFTNDLWLVKTEKLNKILEIDLNNMTVTAEAGVPLFYLGRELAKHGLAPIAFPGAYDITVGGMVANGVHSTGRHGSWVDTVKEVTLVDGKGNVVVISDTSNPQWLPAVRCSLGVLGFIYKVKFCVNKDPNRRFLSELSNVSTILPQVDQLLCDNNEFQFQWNPTMVNNQNLSTIQGLNITDDCKTNNVVRDYGKYKGGSFWNAQLGALVPLPPSFIFPFISDAIVASQINAPGVEFFYKTTSSFHDNQSPSVIMELSIPAELLDSAVQATIDIVQDFVDIGKFFLFIFNETRFVQDEKFFAFLSPYNNFNRPNGSWNFGIIIIAPTPVFQNTDPNILTENALNTDIKDFYETWYNELVNNFQARPTWSNNPMFLTLAQLQDMYGTDNVATFTTVRKALDPCGIFTTPYWEQRLGPV